MLLQWIAATSYQWSNDTLRLATYSDVVKSVATPSQAFDCVTQGLAIRHGLSDPISTDRRIYMPGIAAWVLIAVEVEVAP